MDLLEYINQTNVLIVGIIALCVLWAFAISFNGKGRNFRSSRNKRARSQF